MRRLLVVAVALSALTACAQPADKASTAKVATLVSPSAPASATVSPKAQRPRERLDTTPEEFEALLGPYNKCMSDHGGIAKGSTIQQERKKAEAGPAGVPGRQTEKFDEANKICEPQYYPLPPWEKDPANPEAKDFARETVKCLKEKGVQYVEIGEDGLSIALGGDQNDPKSISMGLDLIPGCERDIAARRQK
ncbi:hypothetical protein Ade02nite_87460 [Paractinoplanes deccanensis]|uniref:Uncharacterized protein n=1 Tax=Paractinoplanes deccanensis TaxID=113561 RepID=A0ABQ3YJD4_9ACTN|nr:hypothetical protein [Actinoplanes deccanensis]GID80105.1 hypothetical protein Ade02nite_87460 [Actinoplanes deccanensis]